MPLIVHSNPVRATAWASPLPSLLENWLAWSWEEPQLLWVHEVRSPVLSTRYCSAQVSLTSGYYSLSSPSSMIAWAFRRGVMTMSSLWLGTPQPFVHCTLSICEFLLSPPLTVQWSFSEEAWVLHWFQVSSGSPPGSRAKARAAGSCEASKSFFYMCMHVCVHDICVWVHMSWYVWTLEAFCGVSFLLYLGSRDARHVWLPD